MAQMIALAIVAAGGAIMMARRNPGVGRSGIYGAAAPA
jgi:hypothetical protein